MIMEGWIVSIIIVMVIPLALSANGLRKGRFDMAIFLCSLSMALTYAIYINLFPAYIVILPVFILILMFFSSSGGGISE